MCTAMNLTAFLTHSLLCLIVFIIFNCLPLSMLRYVGIMVEIHDIRHYREVSRRKSSVIISLL